MKKRILTLCIIISMTIALANATEIGQFIANMVPYKIMINGVEEQFEKPVVNINGSTYIAVCGNIIIGNSSDVINECNRQK